MPLFKKTIVKKVLQTIKCYDTRTLLKLLKRQDAFLLHPPPLQLKSYDALGAQCRIPNILYQKRSSSLKDRLTDIYYTYICMVVALRLYNLGLSDVDCSTNNKTLSLISHVDHKGVFKHIKTNFLLILFQIRSSTGKNPEGCTVQGLGLCSHTHSKTS